MKQNERFLIYAVTGFLAAILVLAVVFSREQPAYAGGSKPAGASGAAQGLRDLLPGGRAADGAAVAGTSGERGSENAGEGRRPDGGAGNGVQANAGTGSVGLPTPSQVGTEQPLMATPKPLVATDIVAQSLGQSRRERGVRFVRARSGDSLDTLVKRWCGNRDPYLAEAQSLNEDLVVLRVGQEVAVPWIDDEVLVSTLAEQKPKVAPSLPVAIPAAAPAATRESVPSVGGPSLAALLGANPPAAGERATGERAAGERATGEGATGRGATPRASGQSYTIKEGDSLWRIAERTYGKKHAAKMVGAIKQANVGLTEKLTVGAQIVLPKSPEGS